MKRYDGRLLKSIGPFSKMVPYIMDKRFDAQVFAKERVCTDKIDAFLHEKRDQGYDLSYLHLLLACYVRLLAERPRLNRFIMNRKIYARKGIYISMAVKRALHDDADETTLKFAFTGKENIFEIARMVDGKILECIQDGDQDKAVKTAEKIMALPGFTKTIIVGILKSMDRHNMLPKEIIEVSPFHSSLFFSYLKSIKVNYVYHHLYDFGTAGIFAAAGKVEESPTVENGMIVVRKYCEIGYTVDERICDGLYFSNSLKLLKKYLNDPHLLETGLTEIEEDVE